MINLPNISKSQEISKNDNNELRQRKIYDYFSTRIQKSNIEQKIKSIKDERFLFFIKYGILRRYDGDCEIIYIEIPQIPKRIVIYRRPYARMKCPDKLNLCKKDLPHIPLFEGEDNLKYLSLEMNQITKIEQLISLSNLIYLNLYGNKISEIENLQNVPKLKILFLGRNNIEKIKNLNCLSDLEILDLHSNKIKIIENISQLKKLRILNLANNLISSFNELISNTNLEELNLRRNIIESIPNLRNLFEKLKKFNLGKNQISKIESLYEFKKLKKLEELILEDNPIILSKEALDFLKTLQIECPFPYYNKNHHMNSSTLIQNKRENINLNFNSKTTIKKQNKKLFSSNSALLIKNEKSIISNAIKVHPIKELWKEEYSYIIKLGYNGYNKKRYKEINILQGYVDIINQNSLIFYGNCFDDLVKENFKNNFSHLTFSFFYFNIIMNKENLKILKQYKRLNSLSFIDNNIYSYYQIIKLEKIDFIENLIINQNEICNSYLLRYFVIYRLQNLKIFNDMKITEKDKESAKKYFEDFDKYICCIEKEKEKEKGNNKNIKESISNNDIDIKNNIVNNINNQQNFFSYLKNNLCLALLDILSEEYL